MAAMQRRDGTASRNVFAWHQQRGHLLPCARLRQEVFQQVVRKAAIVQCRLLMGSVEIGFPSADKVNSLWPNPQLSIALHSPNAPLETGLRMCVPEKSQDTDRT
jgi:hypothetical protein